MPKRIQRKRTKGWRMPASAVYVGRPTKWGNPHKLKDRYVATRLFREYLEGIVETNGVPVVVQELRGKDLACWCPLDESCHADVLLEYANRND